MTETVLKKNWHGPLTVDNIEGVVTLLRQLLGGRRYTFISAHERYKFKPEARTGQRLGKGGPTKEVGFHIDEDRARASMFIHDSYGICTLASSLKDGDSYTSEENPYLEFRENQVTITHQSDSGHKLYWMYVLEDEE